MLVIAILVDAWRWWALKKVARETGSEALEADALHFSSDLVNSVLVLAAFGAAALGYPQADSLVAVGVSLFIAFAGFRLAQRTINTLIDAAPKGLSDSIRAKVAAIPGIVSVERVRLRPAGGKVFGEILVKVPRTLPLEKVVEIKRRAADAIAEEAPHSEIVITAEPTQLDDETLLERVLLIAAKRRVPVHHVMVQDVEGRLSVSLDLEVDGRMSLGAAHGLASKLEGAIRDEFGPNVEVDTHIEPLRAGPIHGVDVPADTADRLASSLRATAAQVGHIADVHSVRVRGTSDGLVVNYHCHVDPALSVSSVHSHVDELERRFRAETPEVLRIVGHAEPRRVD